MRSLPVGLPCFALVAACGGGARKVVPASAPAPGRDVVAQLAPLDRSRWSPESARGADVAERLPDGTERAILGRLRIETTRDGALRRARDLLPATRTSAIALPDRLGGGWAFSAAPTAPLIWKTKDFLGRLEPLARVPVGAPAAVIAGPDRLFVRGLSTDRIEGVDAATGAIAGAGTLPLSPRIAGVAFADARHGVAFVDLRGALFTEDAGVSWRSIPIADATRGIGLEHGELVVASSTGRVRIGRDGSVSTADEPSTTVAGGKHAHGPLGPRPLRAAIDGGWPLLDGTALVARGGVLARVRLEDGAIVDTAPLEGEEDATCTAVRFGVDVGLACGAEGHGTTIHAFVPPLGTRLVARFATPRAIAPSGNGALVVRGTCDDAGDDAATRSYCVLGARGERREVSTRGDVGVERVTALADGRVAVLVPPRGATDGVVTLIPSRGAKTTKTLELPPEAAWLRRGLWLDGMLEAAPGELAGWVDVGGALAGVRVHLDDGTVVVGHAHSPLAVAGLTALAEIKNERQGGLLETLDGGVTWQPVEVPELAQGRLAPSAAQGGVRCGAVGCALPFEKGAWLRVGWGPAADPNDFEDAKEPMSGRASVVPNGPSFTCDVVRVEGAAVEGEPRTDPRGRFTLARPSPTQRPDDVPPLPPFHGAAPPVVPRGWEGFSDFASSPTQTTRLYAWTPKGTASAGAARVLGRLFDRFDPTTPVRSTAISIAPWHDEAAIAEAFGQATSGPVVFHGFPDPRGTAALAAGCHGGGGGHERCDLYALIAGRAVVQLPEVEEEPYVRLFAGGSAVWMDEAFYLASGGTPGVLVIWKIEGGRARVLAKLPRLGNVVPQVRLTRRALGRGLGVVTSGVVGARGANEWFVLPLDPDTGAASEMIRVGDVEPAGGPRRRCSAEDDGWLVEGGSAAITLTSPARVSSAELRMRLDPGAACVEALTATLQDASEAKSGKKTVAAKVDAAVIPLAASGVGRRLVASCRP